MSDARMPGAPVTDPRDPLPWLRSHAGLVAGALLAALFLWWLTSGKRESDTGRYVLVKDDVPCQAAAEAESRRWCYLVLDTRSGKLEERVRKIGSRGRH